MEEIMDWCKVLVYVAGPSGVAVVAGAIWSEVMELLQERYPGVEGWSPVAKRLLFGLVCLVVPVAAAGLGVATCGWAPTWVDTFWPAVAAGLVAMGTGTLVHSRHMGRTRVLPVREMPYRDDNKDRPSW